MRRGFSLVELMVVVVILSILVGFIANEVRQVIIEAKIKGLKNNLKVIRDAIQSYRADKGMYPRSFRDLTDAHPPYLMEIPVDPFSGGSNWLVRPQPYNLLSDVSRVITTEGSMKCTGQMGKDYRLQDGADPQGETLGATWYSASNEVTFSINLGKETLIEKLVVVFEDKPYLITALNVGTPIITSDPVYINKYEYVMRTTSSSLKTSSITVGVKKTLSANDDIYPPDSSGNDDPRDIDKNWVVDKVRAAFQRNVIDLNALSLQPNFTERQFREKAIAWFKGAGGGPGGDCDLPAGDDYKNYVRITNASNISGDPKDSGSTQFFGEYQFGTDFIDPNFNPGVVGGNLSDIPNRESVRVREVMVFQKPDVPGAADIYKWMPEPVFMGAMDGAGYQDLGLSDVKSAVPEYFGF